MLKVCYEEALGLLRENRDVMDLIAAHLIEKETITGKEFMKIYREAKGLPEPEEKKDETGEFNQTKSENQEPVRAGEASDRVGQGEASPIPDAVQQPAYAAEQPDGQGSHWSMPPAYDWNPAARMQQGQSASQPGNPQSQENTSQPYQNAHPQDGRNPQLQNPVPQQYQQPYQNVPQQGQIPPQYQNPGQQIPYPYQNPQNASLPEDNGNSGETSRFGSVWDRNVNGSRDGGNQNSDNRW